MRRAGTAVVVALSLVLPARAWAAPPVWGEDELRWAKNIEKNKGQIEALLGASQAGGSLRAGDVRPLVRRSEAFGGSLRQRDPALHDALLAALQDLVKSAEKGEPLTRRAQRALPLLDRALEMLIAPRIRTNSRFRAAVMASLLLDAAEEYEEWLDEGSQGDYFEGWGNLQRAVAQWQTLLPVVRTRSPKAFREIQTALETLRRFFRSLLPPPREQAPAADELEEAAEDAVSALGEALGGPVLRRGNPLEHARAAVGYLERARTAYRAGDPSLALEYLYAAYFDHYEESKVQKPLAAVAPEREKRITALLRQVLDRVRGKAPVQEIEGLLDQVLAALREAQMRLRTP